MRTNAAASSKNSTRLQPLEPENSHTSASHAVLFYEHDSELLDTLAQSVSTAIMAGNSAIVIATRAHHNQLSALLKSRSVETYAAVLESRLFLLDAEETLARFMVDGQPDSARFAQALGPTIAQLVANARGESPAPLSSARRHPSSGNRESTTPPFASNNSRTNSSPLLPPTSSVPIPPASSPAKPTQVSPLRSAVYTPASSPRKTGLDLAPRKIRPLLFQ